MVHLMTRNRFALGKFVAIMLVIVFLVSIPTAYIGTAASNQKQAAIRETMDEVLARIKEKGSITLDDYEELRNILDGAGGAGKYELDINVVHPHEYQKVDDISASLDIPENVIGISPDSIFDGVRTDIPFDGGTGAHVHDESCLAHDRFGNIIDYKLRCGPDAAGTLVVDGITCEPCTDGRYIISDIAIDRPSTRFNMDDVIASAGQLYTTGTDGKKYIKLKNRFTVTYGDGTARTFTGFQGTFPSNDSYGLVIRFAGDITASEDETGTPYLYTLPGDAEFYFFGFSDDTSKTSFFKPGSAPAKGDSEFVRASCGGATVYKAVKCEHCGHFYLPQENSTFVGTENGVDIYTERCPYCAKAFSSYETNYDDNAGVYPNRNATELTGFQMKGVHPDGVEELITDWTYNRALFANSIGEFDIEVTWSRNDVARCATADGEALNVPITNTFSKTLHINKSLNSCTDTAKHPDGKIFYFFGDTCPYCSHKATRMWYSGQYGINNDLFHLNDMADLEGSQSILTLKLIPWGSEDLDLPYIGSGQSASRGWTYAPAADAELAAAGLANSENETWYKIKAWDYFNYTIYDPETGDSITEVADDNEITKFIVAASTAEQYCDRCGYWYIKEGSSDRCPYCSRKIDFLKLYKTNSTDWPADPLTVSNYYWGESSSDIANSFTAYVTYKDGITGVLSSSEKAMLKPARPSGNEGELETVEIQPGRQTLAIAMLGTDAQDDYLADTTVTMYEKVSEDSYTLRRVEVPVVNHNVSDTVTIIQRMYRCPNELPDNAGYAYPDEITQDGHHYILADENGVCPAECPTCDMLVTDLECTLSPRVYRVSQYGWDDVDGALIDGGKFMARTADGRYHRTVGTNGAEIGTRYFEYGNATVDYTPAPGSHPATITLSDPHICMTGSAGAPLSAYTPVIYDSEGTSYDLGTPDMDYSFTVDIIQDIYRCSSCGNYYRGNSDGSDPGCPLCVTAAIERLVATPGVYTTSNLDQQFDLPSIFSIKVVYGDGTEATTYEDAEGTHTISSACTFTPHVDDPYTYTVSYSEMVRIPMCDMYGTTIWETKAGSATTEVSIRLNITQCEVCDHYYLQTAPDTVCPYCEAKITGIVADAETFACTIADLDDLSGFFHVYGLHPSKSIAPTDEYPSGRTLGLGREEIPFSDLTVEYSSGQVTVTYTNSATAECTTEQGAPNTITINDTYVITIGVILSGKVRCSVCKYCYDIGDAVSTYTPDYDTHAHCPYCGYIFKAADGTQLNSIKTVLFSSYDVTPGTATIAPGTAKAMNANGTQAAPDTYAIVEKDLSIGRILEMTAVEALSSPGSSMGVREGNMEWGPDDITMTVTAGESVNSYDPGQLGRQTFTARYTVTFNAYLSPNDAFMSEVSQTCDITIKLDVYDQCRKCRTLFGTSSGYTQCPHCSLSSIAVTPDTLDEEYGMLRDIRPHIAVVATFVDGHTEAITDEDNTAAHDYVDDFDPDVRGDQEVTISLTDTFDTTKTAILNITLTAYWVCPVCLQRYPIPADGSTPACTECAGTYTELVAAPAAVRKEWSSSLESDDIKGWIEVKVKTRDGEWHDLGADDYTTDFMPSRGIGERAVTITARDGYNNTVSNTVDVTLYKTYTCGICGYEYSAAVDGSDAGCPICPVTIVGYEAGLNRDSYSIDENPDIYFRCVYRDGHKEDHLEHATNNFDSSSAGTKTLEFSYLGETVQGGTYTVINEYLVTCPGCGRDVDSRFVSYDVTVKGYCPECEHEVMGLDVRPSASWIVPGTTNRVYYGTEPDFVVSFIERKGTLVRLDDFEIKGFDMYNTLTTQTVTVRAYGYTGTAEILVIKRGSAEDPNAGGGGGAAAIAITVDGIGYAQCGICGNYYRADLGSCPYCDFAARYGAFIDDPDNAPGFRLKAGSTEYMAFSNVISGEADLTVLDEILDRLYALPGIIEQVKAEPDINRKADLLGLTGEDRQEYISSYTKFNELVALKTANPSYTYSDVQLGQMAYLKDIIDAYETPGYVLKENDIVIVTIRKLKPNVFDYINNLFSDDYEATYFTASAVISKRY